MFVCERCGVKQNTAVVPGAKATRRRSPLCESCQAKPATTVITAYGRCRPHKGPFDANDNPLDDFTGEPYRPGIRLCGNRDCIELKHIETVKKALRVRSGNTKTTAEVIEAARTPKKHTVSAYNLIMALSEVRRRK
jgi:hypothetical protein